MKFDNIEFFVDNVDIICRDSSGYHTFSENDKDLIDFMYHKIKDEYPPAFNALQEKYRSSFNFKYLIVRRFIKCNFSLLDNKYDIGSDGDFHFEQVNCPMRGECNFEHIVCNPQINTALSQRELDVVKLIVDGKTDAHIADLLFISPFTAQNHRKTILKKLGLHSKSQIVDWYHKNYSK